MGDARRFGHREIGVRHGREEYLDYMTFASNELPLFTEISGPIIGLKEGCRSALSMISLSS